MRIPPREIGFDFDGVIADTVEAFIRLACEEYDHCGIRPEDITDFYVEQCLPMAAEVAETIFLAILRDSLAAGLRPMPGSVEVLSEMSRHSEVVIITARPEADPVHLWLDTFFPAQVRRRIRLVAMGDHDGKARHVREQGLRFFVDDRAETCLQLAGQGIGSIVYSQPWNQGRHNLPTVSSWGEIRRLCL